MAGTLDEEEASEASPEIPRSATALRADYRVDQVRIWHGTLERPRDMTETEYQPFVRYCMEFFMRGTVLWKKDSHGRHKVVVTPEQRWSVLKSAHDNVGHKGFYATRALLTERFWWPYMADNIAWFVRTCDLCQQRQVRKIRIPPTVAVPAPIFAKIYMDTMHLPTSGGFKYIVQGRCSLTHYPEWRMLRRENASTLANWIFQDILCRWGTLLEIVTDNGTPFVKALTHLEKQYKIRHIRISGYNSQANLSERPHFDVREALYKAADGNQSKWHTVAHSVFWADRVTVRRRMGCSPFFAVTGAHPLLPLDISEATYLLPPPESVLSTTELISQRAIALQKRQEQLAWLHSDVFEARVQAAIRFERDHAYTIRDYNFQQGDLVLMRNTAIEKSLSRKMRKQYLGPLIVISRNKGGAYILCELDGAVFHRPIAAFRVIPYFARETIELPPLEDLLDISMERLREMEESILEDPEDESDEEETGEKSEEALAIQTGPRRKSPCPTAPSPKPAVTYHRNNPSYSHGVDGLTGDCQDLSWREMTSSGSL
ncbi:unnamed protein product [Mycena citricolor]|uniref:Integrase catalytic domain-containing protein n=1 Tax=Mycena citricolor TaxID=2018698 RepID=A0AAD2HFZ7_9AGAR|nr:unnamed protein product [Mycena citricolor]